MFGPVKASEYLGPALDTSVDLDRDSQLVQHHRQRLWLARRQWGAAIFAEQNQRERNSLRGQLYIVMCLRSLSNHAAC
jgi:hypothetical protein